MKRTTFNMSSLISKCGGFCHVDKERQNSAAYTQSSARQTSDCGASRKTLNPLKKMSSPDNGGIKKDIYIYFTTNRYVVREKQPAKHL